MNALILAVLILLALSATFASGGQGDGPSGGGKMVLYILAGVGVIALAGAIFLLVICGGIGARG